MWFRARWLGSLVLCALGGWVMAAETTSVISTASPLSTNSPASSAPSTLQLATFAGGCFWCVEATFDQLPGVKKVVSGYTGGKQVNPTYEQVSAGTTGHVESVQISFDLAVITYPQLLAIFWKNIDPTVKNRQFCDVGEQYRSAIFVHSAEQRQQAEDSKTQLLAEYPNLIVQTEIIDASVFYPAEEYHQQYHKKNPIRYKFYRANCGRDQRLEELWKRPKP